MLGPGEEMTYSASWKLTYDSGEPVPPGIYQLSAKIISGLPLESEILNFTVEGCQYDITLQKGWNFISLPCEPLNKDLFTVLKPIWPYCRSVWNYDAFTGKWLRYVVSNQYFLNDLQDMETGRGYFVEVTQDVILNVVGLPINNGIQLWPGWNFVGLNSSSALSLEQALASIQYEAIYTYDNLAKEWLRRIPIAPPFFNNLTQLVPGQAYCIYVIEACMWSIGQ